jgi:hypothetical protein
LDSGLVQSISVSELKDCSGNLIKTSNTATFALPQKAAISDLVINEILFNPRSGGSDFVELYNRSAKVLTLQDWQLANASGYPDNKEVITTEPYLVFPGDYVGLTEDVDNLAKEYPNTIRENFIEVVDLPGYNDDEGVIYLLNPGKRVIDKVAYDEEMHFELLSDVEGVSLERIDPNRPSDERSNFHSAAESVGFATPGYQNSQYFISRKFNGKLTVEPEVFSPDNDGHQDVLNLNYEFHAPGYVGSIRIYDRYGRLIRELANNVLLQNRGTFSWDGISQEGNKAKVGVYVIFFEAFNLGGDKEVYKKTAVLASYLD